LSRFFLIAHSENSIKRIWPPPAAAWPPPLSIWGGGGGVGNEQKAQNVDARHMHGKLSQPRECFVAENGQGANGVHGITGYRKP